MAISAHNHGRIVAAGGMSVVISAIGKHHKSTGVMVRVYVFVRVRVRVKHLLCCHLAYQVVARISPTDPECVWMRILKESYKVYV
jgi:hypothetical protein